MTQPVTKSRHGARLRMGVRVDKARHYEPTTSVDRASGYSRVWIRTSIDHFDPPVADEPVPALDEAVILIEREDRRIADEDRRHGSLCPVGPLLAPTNSPVRMMGTTAFITDPSRGSN